MQSNSDTDVINTELNDYELKYKKLYAFTNKLIKRYNLLNLLKAELEEPKNDAYCADCAECAQLELSSYKAEVKEKNGIIEDLRTRLKCKEEDLCEIRRKLDDANNRLEEDLKCAKKQVSETKQMVKKYKTERDSLLEKLKTVRLYETKTAYNEVMEKINDDVLVIKDKVSLIAKLVNEEDKVRKLKEENCVKDDELCRRTKTIEELRRINERKISKIKRQDKELRDCKRKTETTRIKGPGRFKS